MIEAPLSHPPVHEPAAGNWTRCRFVCNSWGMKGALASALCLLLIACAAEIDPSVPTEQEIARVEAKLASHPCIGSLASWERNYRYGMSKRVFWPQSDHPNFDVIEFHLRHVGSVEIAPGSARFGTGSGDWPDSSSIRSIDGSFVLGSGRLSLPRCRPYRSDAG